MACHILQDHERLMLKISSSLSGKIAVNIASLLFLVNFSSVFVNAISGGNNCKIFPPQDFYFYIWMSAYCEAITVLKIELPLNQLRFPFCHVAEKTAAFHLQLL